MCGKILVIRGGAIGDFILTLPAIDALRSAFPEAHLEVLGYPHIIQLAQAAGLVDRAQPIEARPLAGFFARHGELSENWVDYFSEFDLILSYLYDPDGIFQANLGRCTSGQFIAGPHRPDERSAIHAAKVYLKPLERLAIFEADSVPHLAFNPRLSTVNSLALHPGSGSQSKNWPEEKWAELLQHLVSATDFHFLLIGGEAEVDKLQRLSRSAFAGMPQPRLRLAQNLPLVELARLMQDCQLFLGHDSGISHLAAALGLPGLLLWGATSEQIWRPPSQRMMVLRYSEGLAELPVSLVLNNLEPMITSLGGTFSATAHGHAAGQRNCY